MKKSFCKLTALGSAALAAASAVAQAQPAPGGYTTSTQVYLWPGYTGPQPAQAGDIYFNMEAGGLLQQDLYIRNVGQKISFYPGVGLNLSLGEDITEAMTVELQSGVEYNAIDTSASRLPAFSGRSADIDQVPLFANVIFKAPLPGGLTPYVGAGVGGVATTLEIQHHDNYNDDTSYSFAYQALAGVKVALNRNTQLGIGYRFMGMPAQSWFVGDPFRYTSSGQMFSHAVVATLTVSF